ncbi:MAG: 16S rRNA (adenine(1518)-N(6)/adenine(1519)-N(6))-dimethyltransferase RsmA [bacterium]
MLKATQTLCQLYGIKPSRSKGQNFLINPQVYDQIVAAADLNKQSSVLEVGPGLGWLTLALAKTAKQVLAVELDDRLAEVLGTRLQAEAVDNVQVINANILDWPNLLEVPNNWLTKPFQVVANLPYNITSVFLRRFLELDNRPTSLVLLLQKEVAERLSAKPGDMSLLAISVQYYCQPQVLFQVKSTDFWPAPKVDSAVVKLTTKKSKDLPLSANETKLFFRLCRIGFSAKRKMLKNNLANGLHLDQDQIAEHLIAVDLSAKIRAQDLAIADWLKLFGRLRRFMV